MSRQLLPVVQEFVNKVRHYFQQSYDETELWRRVCADLELLLKEPDLKKSCATWPDTKKGKGPPGNLLFYEDPDYKFVLNALVKTPLAETNIHDHGKSWTLYGILEGGEHIQRWQRVDSNPRESEPASLKQDGAFNVTSGYIDLVPPWQIHQEKNGDHRTVGFIVRSQRSGTFDQYRYDTNNGSVRANRGPTQIPYELC